jgi:hypothetical protein
MKPFLWLSAFLLFTLNARADEEESTAQPESTDTHNISSETDVGASILSEQVSGSWGFGKSEAGPPFSVNMSYSYKKATSSSPTAPDVVDITNDVNGGASWNGASGWGVGVTVDLSHTAAESLESRGSTMSVSHRWSSDPDDKVQRSFTLTFNGGVTNMVQSFSGFKSRQVGNRVVQIPIVGTNELRESYGGIDTDYHPDEEWDFQLGFKKYGFNRNVGDFLTFLNSTLAVSRNMNGFGGTVSGIPSATYSAGAGWNFAEDAKLALSENVSSIVVTGYVEVDSKLTVEGQFSRAIKGTVGFEYDWSPTSLSRDVILGLAWDF